MFYAHFVLAKKGPLARIWLAAHWDKKLTKAHVFETNIESSVDGILQPKVKMALRTSGHLLLGVVRIYSRKAKYLLSDCNEAFVKIKMAFRPGMVDLPEDNREAAMNAITLPEVFHDFDTAMPNLDEVDIQAQFNMNQTRAEEITMREDYGNIALDTADDGFGEQIGSPEMLREEQGFGGDSMSLLEQSSVAGEERSQAGLGYTHSMIGSRAGSVVGGSVTHPPRPSSRGSAATSRLNLDAPIQDDGFGGSSAAMGEGILAGGLFEDGSMFDDVPPSLPGSERVPAPSVSEYDDGGDQYGGLGSPGPGSSGGSRPTTPLDNPLVAPLEPGSSPGRPASPAQSVQSARSAVSLARSSRSDALGGDVRAGQEEGNVKEVTTLIHNEEESFALAPVETTAVKGLSTRAKRKRKLIVDDVKAISGEEMKAQLSDTGDIVTTLDLAPPTKRLMHWKETGGVEKLFSLPGRSLQAKHISKDYSEQLFARPAAPESFDTLPGEDAGVEALPLEKVREAEPSPPTPRRETRGRKRKSDESGAGRSMSEYQRRQEELQRQMEESARLEREQLSQTVPPSVTAAGYGEPGTPAAPATPATPQYQNGFGDASGQEAGLFPQQTPGGYSGYQPNTPGCHTPQFPGQTPGYCPSPAPSYPTPVPPSPAHSQQPLYPPALPTAQQQDFTEAWVSQAATATASGAAIPPPQTPTHDNQDWDDMRPDSGMSGRDTPEEEDDQQQEEEEEDAEYQDDETVEQFEDRVLNKRAAKLHFRLKNQLAEVVSLPFTSITKRRDTKKDAAQKFYSLLVLQKYDAVDVNQEVVFGELTVSKGVSFEMNAIASAS